LRTCIALVIVAMLPMLGGSACVNVGAGNSPQPRFFLLEAKSSTMPEWAQKKMPAHTAIGIGPVAIPRYLDRPQILTRVNNLKLRTDEFHQWAEPLSVSIPRIIGENMASLTSGGRIRLFPWNRSTQVNVQVSMDIHRFEADADGKVILKATWRIVTVQDRHLLAERRSIIEQPSTGNGAGGTVEGMSLALSDLSLEIAANLAVLMQTQKKSIVPESRKESPAQGVE
jgi:uncharacterized lipoprotein YmbA